VFETETKEIEKGTGDCTRRREGLCERFGLMVMKNEYVVRSVVT